MKKTFFLAGAATFLLTLAINAQDTTTTKPVESQPQDSTKSVMQTQSPAQEQKTTMEQKKYGNPTVDSILSKYSLAPMPNQLTTEQIFPVIGQYQSSTNAEEKLTITLDDQNKGYVWVDGLPQGRVKGILKKSPATYKIPVQKTAEGNDVPEGTLIYDKDAKTITVMLGRPFNDQDPASVFAVTTNTDDQSMATDDQAADQSKVAVKKTKGNKTKTKVKKEPAPWVFTGTKIEQVTAVNQQQ